jgi:hypothetical protein
MTTNVKPGTLAAKVLLYWLPLGAGGHVVRWNGRLYEAVAAQREHRPAADLYHSALEIVVDADRYVIEMAPAWATHSPGRGVVLQGPVGLRWLGRFAAFRYEIRRWRGGVIPDVAEAVDSPYPVNDDAAVARHLLELVPQAPPVTWGLDELGTGDMWNSNSLIAWLLARSGHDMTTVRPPTHGRAPGWQAGLVLAARQQPDRHPVGREHRKDSRPNGISDNRWLSPGTCVLGLLAPSADPSLPPSHPQHPVGNRPDIDCRSQSDGPSSCRDGERDQCLSFHASPGRTLGS